MVSWSAVYFTLVLPMIGAAAASLAPATKPKANIAEHIIKSRHTTRALRQLWLNLISLSPFSVAHASTATQSTQLYFPVARVH
jgi:hypothetical protein